MASNNTPDVSGRGNEEDGDSPEDILVPRPPKRSTMRPTRGRQRQRRRQTMMDDLVAGGRGRVSGEGAWEEDMMGDVAARALGGKRILRRRVRRQRGGRRSGDYTVSGDKESSESPVERRGDTEVVPWYISSGEEQEHMQHVNHGDSESSDGRREGVIEPADVGEGFESADDSPDSGSDSEDHGTSDIDLQSRATSPAPSLGNKDGSIFDLPDNYVLPSGAVPTKKERIKAQDEKMLGMMRFLKMRKAALSTAE
ncbi:uncharacterized protein H6S33_007005 [Morchella sextelata]|uniref:uncharacterized protein n=1 Tax=Morchella sextelata TaxID=1174677 RepID=UPI001D03A924|nr:uncharacterized protein H6S33_007005 [Morchella sextelata]KAH0603974.1 hypothetical protein H6S33_007005 [Morchella sextelata]